MLNTKGTIQLYHQKAGILANLPCTHGGDLPILAEGSLHYNGKAMHFIELIHIKHHTDGLLYPVVRCRFCDKCWRCDWDEVLPFINDESLSKLLQKYIQRNNNNNSNT